MKNSDLVALTAPESPAAEAYRALRHNLLYAGLDTPLKTVVIATPAPETDHATHIEVAANLAIVAAQADQQVILVDADLRHPTLHKVFGVANDDGLTQALLQIDTDAALPLVATQIPGLRLLPGGTTLPNPGDALGSHKMSVLLDKLAAQATLVLLTAPPVTAFVDAAVLGAKTDGLLLPVRSGQTRRDHVAEARELLERFHVHLLGAVLVDAPGKGMLAGV